ncbi:hypothetical protein AB3S75_041177 [Citrus x aurantiifolia]
MNAECSDIDEDSANNPNP